MARYMPKIDPAAVRDDIKHKELADFVERYAQHLHMAAANHPNNRLSEVDFLYSGALKTMREHLRVMADTDLQLVLQELGIETRPGDFVSERSWRKHAAGRITDEAKRFLKSLPRDLLPPPSHGVEFLLQWLATKVYEGRNRVGFGTEVEA